MEKNARTPSIFKRLSLKNIMQAALLSAVFILLTVATLAVREWSVHVHSANLLEESRVIRAHSGELRDYIIEQILTNQTINVEEMEREASVIGEKGSDLARQTLIPEEFKLLLVSRNDMTKLMARIRLLSTKPDGNEKYLVIYQMLRDIDSRIVKFDENFNRYVQQQWQAIQNLLRGFLAISTMFLTMLLFLLHIYITRPFFELIKNIRKALGKKDTKNQTVDSILAIIALDRQVSSELAACSVYKDILQAPTDPGPLADSQNQPSRSAWQLAAPLLQQHPHYKQVSTFFFNDEQSCKKIPDYLREEVQSRGVVIFSKEDAITFSRIKKFLPYSGKIHAGICFSISSVSNPSGMLTILSNDPESFSDQEVTALNALLRFLEYIDFDSFDAGKNIGETGLTLEELRIMSLSMLNELPPHRGCHNIMNYANGIINCAQIMRDQEVTGDLQENENQKLLTDLWESGKKIAATVNRLRSLQQLYSDPVTSVENSIVMLMVWLELQFPEISLILEEEPRPSLPSVHIPGKDLFLAMALLAEQVIPEPGRDYGSCIFNKLQLHAYLQSEKEVIIEMTLQPKPGELAKTCQKTTATHMRQFICKGLLNCYKSDLEISMDEDQNSTYRFLLR